LPGFEMPVLLYCGQQDSILEFAKSTAALLPSHIFAELPGIGHAASFYSSEEARQQVQAFLALNPSS
jgi:pimeloyl-ACP methyl ester carboxylesterase